MYDLLGLLPALGPVPRRAWQQIVRLDLVPAVMGLVIASGTVMARAADTSWPAVAITIAAAAITLASRLSPLWMLLVGAALGGFGLL